MKVLLIGLGRWGEKHLRVLGELGCEVWVADVSAERRAFAVETGVLEARAVADFRAALPHVDAVDLVTPADNHLALASECLLAGKDCFVEKPMTLTAAEGRELAQIVRSTARVLQVGHIERFNPALAALDGLPMRPKYIACERCERIWCAQCIGRFELKVSEEWLKRQRVALLN